MMHLEIIQGGGISSGFPPAIASILPTIALDSFWAEYYDNSFNPSNWRLKRSLLSLNSNRTPTVQACNEAYGFDAGSISGGGLL